MRKRESKCFYAKKGDRQKGKKNINNNNERELSEIRLKSNEKTGINQRLKSNEKTGIKKTSFLRRRFEDLCSTQTRRARRRASKMEQHSTAPVDSVHN